MKKNLHYKLLLLSIGTLPIASLYPLQECNTNESTELVAAKEFVLHTRSPEAIVNDMGILCEKLLESPTTYHPTHLLEIFVGLLDEYSAVCSSDLAYHEVHILRTELCKLLEEIKTGKLKAAHTILMRMKKSWPQQTSILPAEAAQKLAALEGVGQGIKVTAKLQAALMKSPHSYDCKTTRQTYNDLFAH